MRNFLLHIHGFSKKSLKFFDQTNLKMKLIKNIRKPSGKFNLLFFNKMKKVTTLYQDPSSYNKTIIKKDYYNLINSFIKVKKIKNILDIGCASGDFAYYLSKKINYLGLDINATLLSKAKKNNKKNNYVKFKKINLFDCDNRTFVKIKKKYSLNNFDLITLFGTLTSFSDAKIIIKRLLRLKPKYLILHSHFNEMIN